MNSKLKNQNSKLVFVALGSNQGNSREIIKAAILHARLWMGFPILQSSIWETTPVDCPPDSPKFLNAMVGFIPQKSETPESLLKKLQGLEKVFGRRPKKVINEPRLLDLGLIAFALFLRG